MSSIKLRYRQWIRKRSRFRKSQCAQNPSFPHPIIWIFCKHRFPRLNGRRISTTSTSSSRSWSIRRSTVDGPVLSPSRIFHVGISIITRTALRESSHAQLGSHVPCVFSAAVFPCGKTQPRVLLAELSPLSYAARRCSQCNFRARRVLG